MKYLFVIAFVIITTLNLTATCPSGTGWVEQVPIRLIYTYPDNNTCDIVIYWCKRNAPLNPYGAICEIYIGEIFIKQECINQN